MATKAVSHSIPNQNEEINPNDSRRCKIIIGE
jgi:hypothetical protein